MFLNKTGRMWNHRKCVKHRHIVETFQDMDFHLEAGSSKGELFKS